MVFKKFRVQIILRTLLIVATCSALAYCLVYAYYLRAGYIVVALVLIVLEFIRYIEGFNRDFKNFLIGLLQRDFSTHFNEKEKGNSFQSLYHTMNQITQVFKQISAEKEIQLRYLEMMVQHLRVGIMSFDETEKIHLINNALTQLLKRKNLTHVKHLEPVSESLAQAIREIKSGETLLVSLAIENNLLQLSIHASEFKLNDNYYKLVSMQNIRNELDMKELEAWHKLIRVLTHEIMNSVSPITSLSGTLHDLVKQQSVHEAWGEQNAAIFDKGLDAIRVRGEGLLHFTQSYRQLATLPQPNLKRVSSHDVLARVVTLYQQECSSLGIRLVLEDRDVELLADAELIEQVLINLVKNAMESLSGISAPVIRLTSYTDDDARPVIQVSDNGPGIDQETLEKIFIPFYTTKKNGSGIGLAVSKQILQQHRAQIQVHSVINEGTTFTLVFKGTTA